MSGHGPAVLLLAAGGSRRFGSAKQLARFEGRSLLRRAAESALASNARPVVCVLGWEAERCLAEIADLPLHAVVHEGWSEGMASSLGAGLAALAELAPAASGALVMACDQPRISGELLHSVLAAAATPEQKLVACAYESGGERVIGVPAYFPARCFPELFALTGDRGARAVLELHAAERVEIDFPGGGDDVDREEDLVRLAAEASLSGR